MVYWPWPGHEMMEYIFVIIIILEFNGPFIFLTIHTKCFAPSPRRPSEEYKRMVVELTHGLFIT